MKALTKLPSVIFAVVVLAMVALTASGAPGDSPTVRPTPRPRPPRPNDMFVSVNGDFGNGQGSIYQYAPNGAQSIFVSGISRPRGLAFDGAGNLFVGTTTRDGTTFHATILKFSNGIQSTFATLADNFFPEGMAIDGADNIFVMALDETSPTLAGTIFKFTSGGVQSTFGSIPGYGYDIAFDTAGNLFASDAFDQTIYKFAPGGARSVFVGPSAFTPNSGPVGLAFDRFGNLFVSAASDCGEPDSILKFTPDGVGSTFATDLILPRGVAFDPSGKLFVTELLCDPEGSDIIKFDHNGTRTVFAVVPDQTAGNGPEFIAFPRRHGH